MNPIRTLIIDDEGPALIRLKTLLQGEADFKVCGACLTGMEALDILQQQPVELLLMDIEMPGMNGLELLNKLSSNNRPLVVFITAYDEYAVQAFEYYAIDYILKPFSNERFQKMLARVKTLFINKEKSNVPWPEVTGSIEQGKIPGRITVKTGRKYHFISFEEIAYTCSNGNYCEIILHSGAKHVHRETLINMSTILPTSQFIRIHHSFIIAKASVVQVKRLSFGEIEVKMSDGKWLKVSRRYKHLVKQLIIP